MQGYPGAPAFNFFYSTPSHCRRLSHLPLQMRAYPVPTCRIYNEAITGVMAYGHQLARDPATAPALGIPLYLLDLQRDAELEGITVEWRSRWVALSPQPCRR